MRSLFTFCIRRAAITSGRAGNLSLSPRFGIAGRGNDYKWLCADSSTISVCNAPIRFPPKRERDHLPEEGSSSKGKDDNNLNAVFKSETEQKPSTDKSEFPPIVLMVENNNL